jgi:hypothetical protein
MVAEEGGKKIDPALGFSRIAHAGDEDVDGTRDT